LLGTGIAAALPTAASGLSDWAELRGGTRRVGLVHALGNTTALTLQILSLRARLRGERAKGIGLSTLAMTVASGSAWLGGHLSFVRGVGVNQTAFEELPDSWTPVADASQLGDQPLRGTAGEVAVVLVRSGAEIGALADRCSHRGCSLAEGDVHDGTITCKCHGSTFALDGNVLRGPATAPQPALEARVREGKVEVRRPAGRVSTSPGPR
jgi:nitrite reductase/ring-hydroxylating ferredoxin subunit